MLKYVRELLRLKSYLESVDGTVCSDIHSKYNISP